MVLQCCVKGCETVGNNNFHSFPTNKLRAEKWIAATKAFHLVERLNANKLANSYYKVCRKHFDGSDLTKNGKGQIVVKPDCLPSLFLPNETVVPPASAIAYGSQHQRSLATNKLTKPDEQVDDTDKAVNVVKLISEEELRNHQKTARQTANCSKVTEVTVCVYVWCRCGHTMFRFVSNDQQVNEIDSDVHVVDGISGNHPVNQENSARQTDNCSKVTEVTVNEIEVISVKHPVNQQKSARQTANRSKSSPKASITMNVSRSSKLSYYKRRAKELQQRVKENKINDSTVLNYLKTKFNEQLLEFVDMQLKNCGRSKHGRRYTPKQKSLCLAMYKQGPKAYRFNEKWSCLPTRRTLGRYSAQLIFKSGVDEKILAAVKNIVTNWPASDKYCTFGWDEVSLNEHLDYCQSMDKIEGFVEMCKPKVPIFATHALTFMVRGIAVPYKQSVGYFYTNGVKSFELVELVKLMIERVSTTGLKPILSVCDTCNVNANTVNELVYPRANQTQQTGQLLQYKVNGHRIIHTYDPSHLIKVIRNNFEVKNVAHFISERWQPGCADYAGSIQIAAWDDINQLYRMDIRAVRSVLPKLTDEHLKPNKLKMKVSVATQVFSNTCGTVMLECVDNGKVPEDFATTARFILFVNDLFDSINGCDKYPVDSLKSAVTPMSIHSEFWEYALVMLENMFFVDKGTGERNNRSSVLKKFESTIRGYQDVARTCFQAGIPKLEIRYHVNLIKRIDML
ncbi:uncharacterized protein LOC119084205 isoform X2 [Bradysia coprophila]|uniref:uncharacterized protein LOC119084205 isoform X2 n=1 Tax=Bradysia coprophila TaxID=38358 RepID=UPI00187DCC87|nr:uncharacterized protein LOC119084205 isoform X2 [Bradysia coprophila]